MAKGHGVTTREIGGGRGPWNSCRSIAALKGLRPPVTPGLCNVVIFVRRMEPD